ncbi:MAG: hypothetical protein OXH27_00585 [Gammaproteobacteria bacterium]|nr:hypothetical protein [Gammaproteobacteria bacterium]MCY3689862.1 hypothetical protein [Gammaproteobacteria bacterium]MYA36643.1 hypothetical protein [Gammaproteobacteria bacterium]
MRLIGRKPRPGRMRRERKSRAEPAPRTAAFSGLSVCAACLLLALLAGCAFAPPGRDSLIFECVEDLRREHDGSGWFNRRQDGVLTYREAVRHCEARFPP